MNFVGWIVEEFGVASLSSAGVVSSTLDYETTTGRWNKLEQKKTVGGTHLFSSDWTFNQGTPATDNNQKLKVNVTQTWLDTSLPAGSYWWDYDYDKDNADQLKSATRKANSGGQTVTTASYNYTFDGIGNRTDRNYAANSLNQYKKNPDAADADIDYDLRGNMTTDGVFDFTWNSANQLTSAKPRTVVTLEQEAAAHDNGEDLTASRKVEFGYDDAGRRIWKKSYVYSSAATAWLAKETRKFVYDGNNLVADFVVDPNGMDRLSRAYAWGKGIAGNVGGLLSITTFADDGATRTATYIPLYDDRGNVAALASGADGALVATYQYDPFGKLVAEQGDKAVLDANPFLFSTQYFDRETGLYDFGFRYYSPILQRWLSRDPIAESGGVNVYAFVGNDPINRVDPTGLRWTTLWSIVEWGADKAEFFTNHAMWSARHASRNAAAWQSAKTTVAESLEDALLSPHAFEMGMTIGAGNATGKILTSPFSLLADGRDTFGRIVLEAVDCPDEEIDGLLSSPVVNRDSLILRLPDQGREALKEVAINAVAGSDPLSQRAVRNGAIFGEIGTNVALTLVPFIVPATSSSLMSWAVADSGSLALDLNDVRVLSTLLRDSQAVGDFSAAGLTAKNGTWLLGPGTDLQLLNKNIRNLERLWLEDGNISLDWRPGLAMRDTAAGETILGEFYPAEIAGTNHILIRQDANLGTYVHELVHNVQIRIARGQGTTITVDWMNATRATLEADVHGWMEALGFYFKIDPYIK